MSFKEIIEKEKNEIITTLIKQGNANRTIDYSQFLTLYAQYKEIMSEEEFAKILGINHEALRNLKRKNTRTLILKQIASEEMKNEIKNQLLQKEYSNKKIDYKEFLKLYEQYKNVITEKEFADIIGITYPRYKNIKNRGGKTKVLEIEIDKKQIAMEVEEQYGSILVDYNYFLVIYEPYRAKINSQEEFAEIIGITRNNFKSVKNKGTRAWILKKEDIPAELQQNIREKMLEQGYANKLINYSEFLSLYETYRDKLTEVQFARILGISEIKHRNMKYYDNQTYILKSKKQAGIDRIREVREELVLQGCANRTIDYLEFKRLYSKYKKEMDEIQFAEILGISYANYMTIKNRKSGAIILKTDTISLDLIERLLEDSNIQGVVGTSIDYSYFLELYMPYSKFMTEVQFAEAIGISYTNYNNLKRRVSSVRVDKFYRQRTRIKHLTKENRIYTMEEINDLCERYGISLQEFLSIVYKTGSQYVIEEKQGILQNKGLYIGRKPIDAEILDEYGEEIIKFIDKKSKSMGHRYRQNSYSDDIASDTIMYITQKRGDLFINYETEKALQIVKYIASKYIKYSYISHFKVRTISIDKMNEEFGDHNTFIRDKRQNTEDTAVDNISKRENTDIYHSCINLLQYYYDVGYTNTEAIEKVSTEMNLEKEVMLEMLKKRLMEIKEQKQKQEDLEL